MFPHDMTVLGVTLPAGAASRRQFSANFFRLRLLYCFEGKTEGLVASWDRVCRDVILLISANTETESVLATPL